MANLFEGLEAAEDSVVDARIPSAEDRNGDRKNSAT
jgi:hypothetical protein